MVLYVFTKIVGFYIKSELKTKKSKTRKQTISHIYILHVIQIIVNIVGNNLLLLYFIPDLGQDVELFIKTALATIL